MKEIFKNIEGKEWDKFNHKKIKEISNNKVLFDCFYGEDCNPVVTLADLLANKSWCKAVWGEEKIEIGEVFGGTGGLACYIRSLKAFQILQQQGEKSCITYIKKTMI